MYLVLTTMGCIGDGSGEAGSGDGIVVVTDGVLILSTYKSIDGGSS